MTETTAACPKCGKPHHPLAFECPSCGVIFSRARAAARPAAEAPPAAEPARTATRPAPASAGSPPEWPFPPEGQPADASADALDGVYQGPTPWEIQAADAAAPPPSRAARTIKTVSKAVLRREDAEVETFLTRNLSLSIVAVGILFVLTQAFSASQILGGHGDAEKAAVRFFELTDEDLPGIAKYGLGFTLSGHEFVLLDQLLNEDDDSPNVVAVLYRRGLLAGSATEEELLRAASRLMAALPIELYGIPERQLTISGEKVKSQLIGYNINNQPQRVAAVAIPREDGRPVLLLVAGSTPMVENALREMR